MASAPGSQQWQTTQAPPSWGTGGIPVVDEIEATVEDYPAEPDTTELKPAVRPRQGNRRTAPAQPATAAGSAWLWRLGLPVVLALQAALSLTLVWSNAAFGDEALYLWEGRLEWAHWLHGGPLPPFHNSGAPQIYPPIGAIAAAMDGVPGARLLSLAFMLVATALLYCIGVRLFGRGAALAGAALWAVSEPVLRLAFATYDPLSCLLIIFSAWLAVRAIGRPQRRAIQLACASAITLALAALTAVSFTILIPAVIAISFFAWADAAGRRAAARLAGLQLLTAVLCAVIGITILGQWHNLVSTTVSRTAGLGQGVSLVLGNAWNWDGLLLCLAVAAAVAAVATNGLRPKGLLVVSCAAAAVLVPLYQAHLGTGYSMDKHMSAGSGFAALAAGYGISRLRVRLMLPATAAAVSAAVLLAFPAAEGMLAAQSMFRTWVNVSALVSSTRQFAGKHPVLVHSGNGRLDITVLRYYEPGVNWQNAGSGLAAAGIARGRYSGIVVDMNASLAQATSLAREASHSPAALRAKLLSLAGKHSLIANIENSHRYAIVKVIPYKTADSLNGTGEFIIWRVTPPRKPAGHHRSHRARKPGPVTRRSALLYDLARLLGS